MAPPSSSPRGSPVRPWAEASAIRARSCLRPCEGIRACTWFLPQERKTNLSRSPGCQKAVLFLPGGEDFLFLYESPSEERGIYLATLRDGKGADPVLLMRNETAARYTPAGGGRLLFVRDDNLYAQRLDRTARKLEGEPELIQRDVASSPAFFEAHLSVSRAGVVAWRPGKAGLSQVTIFNRQGKQLGMAGSPSVVQTLRLAPDETLSYWHISARLGCWNLASRASNRWSTGL